MRLDSPRRPLAPSLAPGFGLWLGMILVPLTVLAGESGLPDSRLGIRTAPLLLLSRADVRADLAVDESQSAEAERAVADLQTRAAATRGQTGEPALAARRAIDEAQQVWIKGTLTESQAKRLVQLDLQWEGPSALVSRPILADALGLTPDQRATLTRAIAEHRERRRQAGGAPFEEEMLARKVLGVLTDPQREKWRLMLGQPIASRFASR